MLSILLVKHTISLAHIAITCQRSLQPLCQSEPYESDSNAVLPKSQYKYKQDPCTMTLLTLNAYTLA